MKQILIAFLLLSCVNAKAENNWFTLYTDSNALVKDANEIIEEFTTNVKGLNPSIKMHDNHAVKNTTPYLIYIDSISVNLPFWDEVIPAQKDFFKEVAGGEKEGKEVFGLFFNGFYLVHELAHSLVASIGKNYTNGYANEYEANKIAILYWKETEEKTRLTQCYLYAKKMLTVLKNPVPQGEEYEKYIAAHYNELSADPYKYGYIQFSQFVQIFESTSLQDFNTYIRNYTK